MIAFCPILNIFSAFHISLPCSEYFGFSDMLADLRVVSFHNVLQDIQIRSLISLCLEDHFWLLHKCWRNKSDWRFAFSQVNYHHNSYSLVENRNKYNTSSHWKIKPDHFGVHYFTWPLIQCYFPECGKIKCEKLRKTEMQTHVCMESSHYVCRIYMYSLDRCTYEC